MIESRKSIRTSVCVLLIAPFLVSVASSQAPAVLDQIVLPDGFSIEVWSDEVPNARSLALGSNGTVFVSTRKDGRVYALSPQDGAAPVLTTIAKGLKVPNGVAFHEGALYVAEMERIIRFPEIESHLGDVPEPEVVFDSLPDRSHHGWRYIAFDSQGRLHVSIGAPCNVCEEPAFGNISRLNSEGTRLEVVADGVRNSVGFTWHPETGELWFTDNGRDMLGDDLPPDELNRASVDGLHFGFPYCHAGEIPDPDFSDDRQCSEFVAPVQKLGPHVAPLGVKFYSGEMFPEEYRGSAFIAEHGSWNRSRKIGYRVSMVRLQDGVPVSYETFAEGWLQGDEVSGRPVDLLVLEDGSMLVSDDKEGRIYRISYSRPLSEGIASGDW
jgi:glucose/arabinose dehydrogenase